MNNVKKIKTRYQEAKDNPFAILGFSIRGIPRTRPVLAWIKKQKDIRFDGKNCYFRGV